MRYWLLSVVMVVSACGGSLSDEQRKKMKEGMEKQKIVRVTDSEIMTRAMSKGQAVVSTLRPGISERAVDSISAAQHVNIRFLVPGRTDARSVEQELIEAYVAGITLGASQENLQKLWTTEKKDDYDSLLFSKPHLEVNQEGVEELHGIWNIYMSRKDVVLDISRDR